MSDLPAGRELDVLIAKRMGWKAENLKGGWRVRNGDSKWATPHAALETEVWEDAHEWHHIPHYSTDLNDAASLPLPDETWMEVLVSWGGRVSARIKPHKPVNISGFQLPYSGGEQEAHARCCAWLKWQIEHEPTH